MCYNSGVRSDIWLFKLSDSLLPMQFLWRIIFCHLAWVQHLSVGLEGELAASVFQYILVFFYLMMPICLKVKVFCCCMDWIFSFLQGEWSLFFYLFAPGLSCSFFFPNSSPLLYLCLSKTLVKIFICYSLDVSMLISLKCLI